jgi:Tol biopolymer transport system component
LILGASSAVAQSTTRISLRSDGLQDRRDSQAPAISADGRFVAFESLAESLVPGDTNECTDVFVHDRELSTTVRVSVDSNGEQGAGDSRAPSISADGRFVAFESLALNLDSSARVAGIFVHDRSTGETELVSVDSAGRPASRPSVRPSISADGRYVAFETASPNLVANDTNGLSDVFVRDRETCNTIRASVNWRRVSARGSSGWPAISGDGRFVAFVSDAETLVYGDTNRVDDVFVYDREMRRTTRISVGWDGREAKGPSFKPSISHDGRFVAFASDADNLVRFDRGQRDVFVRDRRIGETRMVSVDSLGEHGNLQSGGASISADGRWIAFHSSATNLVADDSNRVDDVFLYDSEMYSTSRVSRSTAGEPADSFSYGPSVSSDGSCVAFTSRAKNLAGGDTNGAWDVFVFDARPLVPPCMAYYADRDGDGFGNPNARVYEMAPRPGYVLDDTDCEDRDPAVHGGAIERYNGVDDDCDGEIDEGFVGTACSALANSLSCEPLIVGRGAASATGSTSFEIAVESLRNDTLGFLVWSRGSASILDLAPGPCVSSASLRSPLVRSGGSARTSADCSGRARFDLGPDVIGRMGFTPSTVFHAQYVGRDRSYRPYPGMLVHSAALWFVVAP